MTMIERTPYQGDEIQLFELTPEEVRYFDKRDKRTMRRAIIRCTIRWWFGLK